MTLSKLERDLFEAIAKARHMTKERVAKAPGSNLFYFADIQLDEIERLIKQPLAITVDDARQIKLDLMAVREFGQEEQDYINALCLVSYLFKKLINSNEIK
tara:strand:+ start:1598 stop:1900 length:303 start_codon:yes stop_codon:yes gene_type:complete